MTVAPAVDWSLLVQSLNSYEVLEHQGWAISEFFVSRPGDYLVRCQQLHTVHVDHTHVMSVDLYGTGEGGGVLYLEPGPHTLR